MSLETLELLQQAQAVDAPVEIMVTDALYACCNRPLIRRVGYLQTYRGVVADLDDHMLLLHSLALRALNYRVIAELGNVEQAVLIGGSA